MEYSIHTDVKYGPLDVVDARGLADEKVFKPRRRF